MKKIKAAVLGSINFDCVAKGPRLPKKGETVRGHSFGTFVGGKGANQAVQLARLGADVTFIGKVGDDDVGKTLRASLESNGICTDYLSVDADTNSGACNINIDENGDNTLLYAPGANERISKRDIDAAAQVIRSADIFITQNEINLDMAAYGLRMAKESGVKTLLNPAPARELPSDIYPMLDYIVPNETETEVYCGFEPDISEDGLKRAAAWFIQRGAANVVITLGENGAFYVGGNETVKRRAYKIKAVDTTAAGDAFIGGFSYIIAKNGDAASAMQYGNACGALAASRDGAQVSIGNLDEVCMLMQEHGENDVDK